MDRRELILTRLLELLGGLSGVVFSGRNVDEISDSQRPALIVYDADESADENDPESRPAGSPRRIGMTPGVFLLLNGTAETVGPLLNEWRAKIVKAVLTDATLLGLTHDGRGIRYQGLSTGLSRGRKFEGEIGLSFTFTYILKPGEL